MIDTTILAVMILAAIVTYMIFFDTPVEQATRDNDMKFMGAWTSTKLYRKGEVVKYMGGSYVALKFNKNKEPITNAEYWDILVSQVAEVPLGIDYEQKDDVVIGADMHRRTLLLKASDANVDGIVTMRLAPDLSSTTNQIKIFVALNENMGLTFVNETGQEVGTFITNESGESSIEYTQDQQVINSLSVPKFEPITTFSDSNTDNNTLFSLKPMSTAPLQDFSTFNVPESRPPLSVSYDLVIGPTNTISTLSGSGGFEFFVAITGKVSIKELDVVE